MAVKLDEYLCNLQFGGMELGTTLLIGWTVFALFIVLLGVFIYNRHLKPRKVQPGTATANENGSKANLLNDDAAGLQGTSYGGGKFPFSSSGKSTPFPRSGKPILTATVSGIDKDAVPWVNQIISWVYNDPAVSHSIVELWMKNINKITSSSTTEVSYRDFEILSQFA